MNLLFRTLATLPLGLLQALGWALGCLVALISPTYRRRLLANARQAGFGAGLSWRAAAHAGAMVMELPRLWLGSPVPVTWEGEALIDQALAQGQGVVFLTPHLGSFEVTAQAYAQRFGAQQPMTVLFRPARQAGLQAVVAQSRQRPGLLTAPTSLAGVKQLIQALRRGQCVGLLPDQVPPQGQGVWAPFFGQDAYTMTLSVRLAQQTGACVLLAWGERRWGGFVVHVHSLEELLGVDAQALQDLSSKAGATLINRAMERLIERCPQQYLWGYARYKSPRQEAP
jgi:KDO2-lipid IV(A) lauroyltransferase